MRRLSVIIFLFLAYPLSAGSVINDFRRDLPAIWRCWSLRYAGGADIKQETPFCMEGDTPIILVHGYLNTNTGWIDLRKKLEEAGYGPVYAPTLHSSSQDIRQSAFQIGEAVEYVRQENGGKPVILIGHSMGGIIAAYCAQHVAPEGSVRAVVTLGTPIRGTKTASIAFGRAALQMKKDSHFLTRLCAQICYQPKAEFFCLGSKADEVVRPFDCSFYKEPDNDRHFHLYADVGHQSFLFDETVANDIVSMIETLDDAGRRNHP